jgi:chromosome segregation ATPase
MALERAGLNIDQSDMTTNEEKGKTVFSNIRQKSLIASMYGDRSIVPGQGLAPGEVIVGTGDKEGRTPDTFSVVLKGQEDLTRALRLTGAAKDVNMSVLPNELKEQTSIQKEQLKNQNQQAKERTDQEVPLDVSGLESIVTTAVGMLEKVASGFASSIEAGADKFAKVFANNNSSKGNADPGGSMFTKVEELITSVTEEQQRNDIERENQNNKIKALESRLDSSDMMINDTRNKIFSIEDQLPSMKDQLDSAEGDNAGAMAGAQSMSN